MLRHRINISSRPVSNLNALANQPLRRFFSTSKPLNINQVRTLPNWDLETFQRDAFNARVPAKLPRTAENTPLACTEWFIHDSDASKAMNINDPPRSSELRTSFWTEHESTIVPLELTSTNPSSPSSSSSTTHTTFTRTDAPLQILLTSLTIPTPNHSIYLAQCPLPSLPSTLTHSLPTPSLVLHSGKGDIYSSSLWLGRAPTYTPLHRDPNPNLLLQLAGTKVVRLLPPEVGDTVFGLVQENIAVKGRVSAAFRGEEMMAGPERAELHRVVWGDGNAGGAVGGLMGRFASEARLGVGEALFIPKGWWHSVVGTGEGVTASSNWWFR